MTVGAARSAAVDWVARHAQGQPGFRGAYFIGSSVGLSDDAELAPDSDIDVAVLTSEPELPLKPGKLLHDGALLEISVFPWQGFSSVDNVLSSYHLAAGLRFDTVIADPTGDLRPLQRRVARAFAEELWVRRRCENALGKVENLLGGIDPRAPWHDQVTAWLFATGVTTHVLLVAAMRNPTVRLRYLAVREVLAEYDRLTLYPDLLELLGCADMTPQQTGHHLDALARTFDAAAAVAKTPFPFSSDITPLSRSIVIDGSRKLIESGNHREAVFWIVATFARCNKILAADAPRATQCEFAPAFDAILADLGISSLADLFTRRDDVHRFLPRLWDTAEEIIDRNPGVGRSNGASIDISDSGVA
jgi:hypothetical protein